MAGNQLEWIQEAMGRKKLGIVEMEVCLMGNKEKKGLVEERMRGFQERLFKFNGRVFVGAGRRKSSGQGRVNDWESG